MATTNVRSPLIYLVILFCCCNISYCQLRQYDYLWLVEQWPPSYCELKNCSKPIPTEFKIHGTWPQLNNSKDPLENCDAPNYNESELTAKMEADLKQEWPNLKDPNKNKEFWEYEWTKHGKYDYLWLVEQWPPSYCELQNKTNPCSKPIPTEFKIHGTWPKLNNSKDPLNCDANYNESETAKMEADLKQEWPNLKGSHKNAWFWKHEWTKHGSCALPRLNQLQYFEKTLALKKRHNLKEILEKAGIPAGGDYPPKNIEGNITRAVAKPVLRCRNKGKQQFLLEIALCVDAGGEQVIPCNDDPKKNKLPCTAGKINFPAPAYA